VRLEQAKGHAGAATRMLVSSTILTGPLRLGPLLAGSIDTAGGRSAARGVKLGRSAYQVCTE
jgi:hypothetical protein